MNTRSACLAFLASVFCWTGTLCREADAFCRDRPEPQCCSGREDECSMPLPGTKCYCDDFCERGEKGDCCKDYLSFCKRITPNPLTEPIRRCYFEGRSRENGERWTSNCNECECKFVTDPDRMEVMCTMDDCMIDDRLIMDINRNERSRGWRAGRIDAFWGHRLHEGFEKKLGTLYARKQVLNMQSKPIPVFKSRLPASFDSRDQWPEYVTKPQDQGWCANSWVWSTVGVASDRWGILSNGQYTGLLSAQHLFACNSRNQKGCSGGFLTKAWNFIHRFGLVTDSCLPWSDAPPGRCVIPKKTTAKFSNCPTRRGLEVLRRTSPLYRISGEEQIMTEIMERGPVQATMTVFKDFFVYKGGVYKCPRARGNNTVPARMQHSVRVVGWGETSEYGRREKYWIAANSWGQEWGDNGYFRILRGTNECNIESFVLAMTVNSSPALDPYRLLAYNYTTLDVTQSR